MAADAAGCVQISSDYQLLAGCTASTSNLQRLYVRKLTSGLLSPQFLELTPSASGLVEEIKNNTQHYISVIAEAADSQLATLSVTGRVNADIYDTLLEAVSGLC